MWFPPKKRTKKKKQKKKKEGRNRLVPWCTSGEALPSRCIIFLFCQEINFYKVIDYILHGKEDIKVIP
jgi:hypothetical protein